MSCEHCKSAIGNSLKKLNGLNNAEIDLTNKTISIDFSEDIIELNEIISTINKLGYLVKIEE